MMDAMYSLRFIQSRDERMSHISTVESMQMRATAFEDKDKKSETKNMPMQLSSLNVTAFRR